MADGGVQGGDTAGSSSLFEELKRRRVLRTAAWYGGGSLALLQGAEVLVDPLGLPAGTVRALAILALAGFPLALAFSWVYQVAPQNGAAAGSRRRWSRRSILAAGIVVSVGIAVLLLQPAPERQADLEASPPSPSRLAVLSLPVPTSRPDLQDFADYLHARLIDGLSAAGRAGPSATPERLRVISRAGVLPFSGGRITLDSIARALDVGTVVEGSIEAKGEAIVVRLRLVDARTAEQLDAAVVEMRFTDRLTLVDAVADTTVALLKNRLGPTIQKRRRLMATSDRAAFDAFEAGLAARGVARRAFATGALEEMERSLTEADSLFDRAERQDQRWADPVVQRGLLASDWAALANARGAPDLTGIYRRALSHAERALERDGRDAEGLYLRGAMRAQLAARSSGSDRESMEEAASADLRNAARIHPQPARALRRLSEIQARQGRYAAALTAAQRAYEEDPYLQDTPFVLLRLFEYALRLDRDHEAAEYCREGAARFPASGPIFIDCRLVLQAWTEVSSPAPDEAWRLLAEELEAYPPPLRPRLEPRLRGMVAASLARAGLADSARVVLTEVEGSGDTSAGALLVRAGVLALLGEVEGAVALVDSIMRSEPGMDAVHLSTAPELRPLRDHPSFRHLTSGR